MPSRAAINLQHVDCDYNKCRGREISLGHHQSCPLVDEEDADGEYDIVNENSDSESEPPLTPVPQELFDDYPPDRDQQVYSAMQYSKEHKSMHWSFCQDFYCKAHGSMNQTKNRYFSNSRCSVCGTLGHGVLNCPLAEEVIQKEKECKAMLRTEHNNQWLPPCNDDGVWNLRQVTGYTTRIP